MRVIDLKRGESLRLIYRIQVLLYALQLDAMLADEGLHDVQADLQHGAAWLGWTAEPTLFEFDTIRPTVERFLREDMPRIFERPMVDVHWHLYFRCEWCEYFDHCRGEMRQANDLSRLVNLTVNGKRYLWETVVVKTVPQFSAFLQRKDADDMLAQSAPLAGRRSLLLNQTQALQHDAPLVHGTSSPALPKHEDVAVFVTLQHEPLSHTIYLAGFLASGARKASAKLGWDGKPQLHVLVADNPAPETLAVLRRRFIRDLYRLLAEVDNYNTGREWLDQISLQMYVHTEQERTLLVALLLEALNDAELAEAAMTILFHVHGPDLMLTDEHPEDVVPYPIVVLLNALGRFMALPVDTSYTLPESLAAMNCTFTYRRLDYIHFPLGHGFRPDIIHNAWHHNKAEQVQTLHKLVNQHLFAVRALLGELRRRVAEHLFAWPPKFALPRSSPLADPLLSRLAFFSRYECLLQCLALREARGELREVLALQGALIELEALSDNTMKVVGTVPVEVKESTFPSSLLVRDSEAGRQALMTYPDLPYRAKPWGGRLDANRAIVSVPAVKTDALGYADELSIEYSKPFDGPVPRPGQHFLLYPDFLISTPTVLLRFWSVSTRRLTRCCCDSCVTLRLPTNPCPLLKGSQSRHGRRSNSLRFTLSQRRAYRRICTRKMTLIWGPPGTGKTWFLAAAILGLAQAHAKARKPFRVLVSAFTHAAIENVLRQVATLRDAMLGDRHSLPVAKAKLWQGHDLAAVEVVDESLLGRWVGARDQAVLGGTVWSCLKDWDRLPSFDLVVVDEASQVCVSEAAVPVSALAARGRLILAGDDKQLPPIVHGTYPAPEEGETVLHRSIFEAVRTGHGGEELVQQLQENFRMNDVLTSYAARLLYGPGYRCVSEAVANRRLPLTMSRAWSPLVRFCVSPAHSMVLVLVHGATAGRENECEAALVADLVCAVRERLRDASSRVFHNDADFFRHGLFIVSPHHVQIRMIKRMLNDRRTWDLPPFIDTVEKMQGQEAETVIVSYGVSDPDFALQEAEFIYGLNRLNVAITRARSKSIICLPEPLVRANVQVLEIPEAERGLAFMSRLIDLTRQHGEGASFDLGGGITAEVLRTSQVIPGA